EVQYAYAASDLIVGRSGASSLTEVAFYELPAVLVPYPFAADDHQTANAEIFSGPGAAELWKQGQLGDGDFAKNLADLVTDETRLKAMRQQMRELAIPDASERVCDVIEKSLI
ncbi:MAG: glycosyltransferase, partial [Verrucomicrobiota bacterium]